MCLFSKFSLDADSWYNYNLSKTKINFKNLIMTNLDKIHDYLQIMHERVITVINAPYSFKTIIFAASIFIVALITAKLITRKISLPNFPKCLIQRTLFPILSSLGLFTLGVINLIITGNLNDILYFFILISLAGIAIGVIDSLIIFAKNSLLRKFHRVISIMLWFTVFIMVTDRNNDIVNFLDNLNFYFGKAGKLSVWDIMHGVLVTIAAATLAMLVNRYLERRIMHFKHIDNNLQQVFIRISKILIFLLALIITLPIIGVDVTALSVFGGALGVGIAFGLQKIASNFFSGFIILLDRSIKVGDRLIIDNNKGIVKEITTRYVVMERFDGTEVIIPNETFITSSIQNQSYSSTQLRTELTFNISDNNDINHALELIKEVLMIAPDTMTNKSDVIINGLVPNGIEIKAYFWVNEPIFITPATNYIYINVIKEFKDNAIISPQPDIQSINIVDHDQPTKT